MLKGTTIIVTGLIILFVVLIILAIMLGYRLYLAKKWTTIAEEKGYTGSEAKHYHRLALLCPAEAERMIIALPDRYARPGKKEGLQERKENGKGRLHHVQRENR